MTKDIQQQSTQLNDFKSKALATFSVFARNQTFLGLPSNVFIMGITITACIGYLFWLAGAAFGFLFFHGMYKIHQKDPKAFEIWIKALRSSFINKDARWNAGNCKSTRLIIIKEGE